MFRRQGMRRRWTMRLWVDTRLHRGTFGEANRIQREHRVRPLGVLPRYGEDPFFATFRGKRWWRHRRPRSSSPRNTSASSPLSVVVPAPHLHKISSLIHSLRSSSPGQSPTVNQTLSKVCDPYQRLIRTLMDPEPFQVPLHKKPQFVVPLHHTQAPEHTRVDMLCQVVGAGSDEADGNLVFAWSGPALSENLAATNAGRISQEVSHLECLVWSAIYGCSGVSEPR